MQRTERRGWLTVTFLALLSLGMAGCGGSASVAHRTPTPTPTLLPTTTPSPTAAPTAAVGLPCGMLIDASNPVAATVGDLQFTTPRWLAIAPLRRLPASVTTQPFVVDPTGGNAFLNGFTPVNVQRYSYIVCNNSATMLHVMGQFTVKLNAFTAEANVLNVTSTCIHIYSRQGMLDRSNCGGSFAPGTVNLVASFAAASAQGTVESALDMSGQQVAPLSVQPGYAIEVQVIVTPPSVAGTSMYRFGVGVDGTAPVYPAVDSIAVLNSTTLRHWDGDACLSSAMQALIPAATTPPTYYICPPA